LTTEKPQLIHPGVAFQKITALWALNEAALGGLLHALDIPFTGLIVGGVASVLIALLAFLSEKRGAITKATLVVIIIKAVVSPYTPIAAFVAVFIQGFIGELLFSSKKFFAVSAIALAVFASLYSALQKLFLVTLLFGTTLWKSIDLFFNYVLKQLSFLGHDIHFSYYLILFYLMLHLVFGFLFGLAASRVPKLIDRLSDTSLLFSNEKLFPVEAALENKKRKRRKLWFQKGSGFVVLFFLIAAMIISYKYGGQRSEVVTLLLTIFRAVLITLVWLLFVGPIAMRYFKKFIEKNKNKYTGEIEMVLEELPVYKEIISLAYQSSSNYSGAKRLKKFVNIAIVNILFFKRDG